MKNASAIVFSGIAPHPPIMVPEVGGEAIAEVRGSIEAMAELTKRLVEAGTQTVVLISPHAPLEASAFVAYYSAELYGDFSNFRAPSARVSFPLDTELLQAIISTAASENYPVVKIEDYMLDHGSAVPLYFLDRNGWRGRVVALGYSFRSNEDHLKFGSCIRKAADAVGGPVGLIASGDLSHRLKPDAPAGFNPTAHLFDEEVVEAIAQHNPGQIARIDPDLRHMAGECGYRSMLIALGATRNLPEACEVLHYEAPFGVGYLVAQLTNARRVRHLNGDLDSTSVDSDDSGLDDELPALARQAVETFVRTGEQISSPYPPSKLLGARAGCFVCLKTRDGELRGCIGTIEPAKDNLAEELIANAINSATRDPRFPPVGKDELADLVYSVDILAPPERTTFEELDPLTFGVIVEDDSGLRRGLLLPEIEGVDTPARQVDIAKRKAGIEPDEPVKLSRFRVDRYRE